MVWHFTFMAAMYDCLAVTLAFTFTFMLHFELVFVKGARSVSRFTFFPCGGV